MWVAIDFTYGVWSKVEGLDSLLKKHDASPWQLDSQS